MYVCIYMHCMYVHMCMHACVCNAYHAITLLSKGTACMPMGGSFCSRLKSRINRLRAAVDILKSELLFVVSVVVICDLYQ